MPDKDDQDAVSGMFEAARRARDEREKALGRIFGGAHDNYEERRQKLEGLFGNREPEEEPSPLGDFVGRAKASKEARQKEEGTLFETERQERLDAQREMTRRLFGREPTPEVPPEEPKPKRGRKTP